MLMLLPFARMMPLMPLPFSDPRTAANADIR